MKVAISSTMEGRGASVSDVFARCPYFIIAEIADGKIQNLKTVKNINANQPGQAGISAAKLMAEKGINAVITKNVGPRALDILKQFDIAIYYGSGETEKVLQEFINGKLKTIN